MISKTKIAGGMIIVFAISVSLLYIYVYFAKSNISAGEIVIFGTFLAALSLLTDIIKNISTSSQSHQ